MDLYKKKSSSLAEADQCHPEWGKAWVWLAFDPINKLIIHAVIGKRTGLAVKGAEAFAVGPQPEYSFPVFINGKNIPVHLAVRVYRVALVVLKGLCGAVQFTQTAGVHPHPQRTGLVFTDGPDAVTHETVGVGRIRIKGMINILN